jgi:hypothetical protein
MLGDAHGLVTLCLLVSRAVYSFSRPAHSSTLMAEVAGSSETFLLSLQTTRRHTPTYYEPWQEIQVQSSRRFNRPRFTCRKVLWYPFLLEAESTPGTSAAGRTREIENINSPHGVSNPRLSGL